MKRADLFEHMLSDPYHSKNRKGYLKELRDKGWWLFYGPRTLETGTVRAKALHEADHSHPAHEHDEA